MREFLSNGGGYGSGGYYAALDFGDGRFAAAQPLDYQFGGAVGTEGFATGEYVGGGVGILGPSMHTDVGFGDGYDSGNADWIELVEHIADYGCAGFDGGLNDNLAHTVQVIQQFRVTLF